MFAAFAVRCLLATATLYTTAAAGQPPLEAELAVGGLNEPHALSDILRDVGLHSIGDVQHLNAPEQLELSESLRAAGVDLGSRSRLRRLSDGAAIPTAASSSHESFPGDAGRPVGVCRGSLQPRRAPGMRLVRRVGGSPSAFLRASFLRVEFRLRARPQTQLVQERREVRWGASTQRFRPAKRQARHPFWTIGGQQRWLPSFRRLAATSKGIRWLSRS